MKALAAACILLSTIALHAWALHSGLYELQMRQGFVWFDKTLHIAAGFAFGLVWLQLLSWAKPGASRMAVVLSLLAFVLCLAGVWELCERAFYLYFHAHPMGFKVYAQPLSESIKDMSADILGALILLLSRAFTARGSE